MKPYLGEHVMSLMQDGQRRSRIRIWAELGRIVGCRPSEVLHAVQDLVECGSLRVGADGHYEIQREHQACK